MIEIKNMWLKQGGDAPLYIPHFRFLQDSSHD
jgi:hypothetical protein